MSDIEIITTNNNTFYKKNGKLHRENGPAIEDFYGGKEWFIDGERHREDGPAVIIPYNGDECWYINGFNITDKVEKWIKDNNIPHYSTWTKKEIALFKLMFIN